MKYATIDQLKQHLEVTDSSRDEYYDDVLDRVSAVVDTYTGRTFGQDTVTVTDELHNGARLVWLKHTNIADVTAIEGRDKHTDSWTALVVDDYEWTHTGCIEIGRRYRYLKVTYTYDGGGTTPPPDVIQATLELAAAEVASGTSNVTKTRIGDLEMNYSATSTSAQTAYALLDRYRVRNV